MRAAVLGGTFDPPHVAHLALAAAARRALDLDRVVLVPAGEPWRKAKRAITPAATRLRMVEAAVASCLPWAEVGTCEIERAGPSYAWETMEQMAADGGDWWFVLGEDALEDLVYWREPERLLRAARLAVAVRPEGLAGANAAEAPRLEVSPALREALPGIEQRLDRVPMTPLLVSSTELRRRVAAGEPTEPWLPETVRAVVDDRGLYRG